MDIRRQELLPGVWLNCLETTGNCVAVSINLLSQLERENASANALIPTILCQGTKAFPTTHALAEALSARGEMKLTPMVRRFGEVHSCGIYCEISDLTFLREGLSLAGQILAAPHTKGGLFLPQAVTDAVHILSDSDAQISIETLLRLCSDQMCCYEDYSINENGDPDSIRSLSYLKISKYYKDYIRTSPIEIVVTGPVSVKQTAKLLKDCLCLLPRGDLNDDIGTDIRMNSLEEEPRRVVTELHELPECTIHGYRIGEWMDAPDIAALEVFSQLTGAVFDLSKGVLFLHSPSLSLEENPLITTIKEHSITPEALQAARQAVQARFQDLIHKPDLLDRFILEQLLSGLDYTPDVVAELAGDITDDDLAQLADSIACDLILQNLHLEEELEDVAD